MLHAFAGEVAPLRAAAQEALEIAERHRVFYYHAWARLLLAWAAAWEEPGEEAIAALRGCIAAFCDTGARARLAFYYSLLASVYLKSRRPAEALTELNGALQLSASQGESWWDAELHRGRGEALAMLAHHDEALAACDQALVIARAQHSSVFEARTMATRDAIRANAHANT
jgi:tetratricopeptide (TPR) repeat protein